MTHTAPRILACDVGGTKTRLALFPVGDGPLLPAVEVRYASSEFDGLESLVQRFRAEHPGPIVAACFGVAGPVIDGRCYTTNLPWVVEVQALQQALGVPRLRIMNDLEATAWGIGELTGDDLIVLNAGPADAEGNAAVIAAGTGLGEAGLYWDGRMHHPFASEGGHVDFSPRNPREIALLEFLLSRYGRGSWERVLSGPGLVNLYEFLKSQLPERESPRIARKMAEEDPAAVITGAALAKQCGLCSDALSLFVELYGSAAGNLALKLVATGGLYIGGGIAPRILPALKDDPFLKAFVGKGRMQHLLERVPVRVILNDRTALLGAARCACNAAQR